MTDTKLWEVLVPASSPELKFTIEHHHKWDEFVRSITGGLTVCRAARGQWVSPTGKLYRDRVIPCRIACTREQLNKILAFTITHYKQEAVMAYLVSDEVIIEYKKPSEEEIIEGYMEHYGVE